MWTEVFACRVTGVLITPLQQDLVIFFPSKCFFLVIKDGYSHFQRNKRGRMFQWSTLALKFDVDPYCISIAIQGFTHI